MSSFKKLNSSDVTIVPYAANKQWDLNFCAYPNDDSYITIYKGTKLTSSFNPDTDPETDKQYERLIYNSINHLFYQSYSGSLLDTSSLANSLFYESASQQKRTQSYFNYNENPALIKNFPSGNLEGIRVLAINQGIFGSQVLPYNFILSSSAYFVVDDGKGNLFDIANAIGSDYVSASYVSGGYFTEFITGSDHIGNIFYAHGLGVITDQNYQLMFPLPPLANNDNYTYKLSDPQKPITPLDNDVARSGTLIPSSIILSGSQSSSFNIQANGTGSITASVTGVYETFYTVAADLGNNCSDLISNQARIRVNITDPDCNFTFIAVRIPDPSPSPTPSITPSITATPSLTPTSTPSITPTLTQTPTSTPSLTPSITITPTITQTPTQTPTITPSITPSITITPTQTPSITITPTTTQTPTQTPASTSSPTPSITPSVTITPTVTPSITPSVTITPTITISTTPSITPTPSAFPTLFLLLSQTSANDVCTNGELGGYTWILGSRSDTSLCDTSFVRNTSSGILSTIGIGNFFWLKQGSSSRKFQVALFSFGEFAGQTYGLAVEACVVCASPSPTPTITPSITTTPTITPSISISATPSITPSITISRTPTQTPTTTPTITPSITITPTRTPSITPSITPSPSINAGIITVRNIEDSFGCAGTSAARNGTYDLSAGGNNTVSGSIAVDVTFAGSVFSDCYGSVSLYVNSTTRGNLFTGTDGNNYNPTVTSGTYTRLTGEDISITGSFTAAEPPPPCFVAGTMITLSDGSQAAIETLSVGVELESSLINTLEDTNNVAALYEWSSNELLETRTTSTIAKFHPEDVTKTIIVNNGLLEATENHTQLAKVDNSWRMISMEKLVVGNILYASNGDLIPVTSIEINTEPRTVYKLTLSEESHTYFANNILTHNIK
jgi:hypothetical protein